jgi:hypothetical protein
LNNFWYAYNEDDENSTPYSTDVDSMLFRLCESVGADIRPIFHFWGTPPVDAASLDAAITGAGLTPCPQAYELLQHYKTLIPDDNAGFQQFADDWWGRPPSIGGYWTEREHARQWDTNELWDPMVRGNGEIYDEAAATGLSNLVQGIIETYWTGPPPGPFPPTPDPMTFAIPPYALDGTSVTMSATVAFDPDAPVEYYFENTTNGNFQSWSTNPDWTDITGLVPGQTYGYRVKARDAQSNETAWSAIALAVPLGDAIPPAPDPMSFSTAPTPFGSMRIYMVATIAVDDSEPIEYYFENLSNGTFSGWTTNPAWTNSGLTDGVTYGYRVRARDAYANTTEWSAVSTVVPNASAVTNIMIAEAGGTDSWNLPANWSLGHVPLGAETAVINSNLTAYVGSPPPTYQGDLIIRNGATVSGWTHATAVLGAIPSTSTVRIVMGNGASIVMRTANGGGGAAVFAPIELEGNAEIWGGASTSGHHTSRDFNHVISGAGMLTLAGINNNTFNLNTANTFSGGFRTADPQGQGHRVRANVGGAFGSGDVTISSNCTLFIRSADTIHDLATLYLEGPKSDRSGDDAKVEMEADETVVAFYVDGVEQASGTWGSSASGAANVNDTWFIGPGILTVAGLRADLALALEADPGSLYGGMSNLTYTLNIDNIGTTSAVNVMVTNTLSAGLLLALAVPSPTQTNGTAYTFNLGDLAAGSSTSVVIDTVYTSTVFDLTFTNQASLYTPSTETTLTNNLASIAITITDPDADSDGDSMTDAEERIAGTLHNDPASYLWLQIDRTSNQTVRMVSFLSVSGRTYHVQCSTNIFVDSWTNILTGMPGSDSPLSIPVSNHLDRAYYRIGVEQP